MNAREQLLEAAERLIPYRGFTKTSVGDILKECGVGQGNFSRVSPGSRHAAPEDPGSGASPLAASRVAG